MNDVGYMKIPKGRTYMNWKIQTENPLTHEPSLPSIPDTPLITLVNLCNLCILSLIIYAEGINLALLSPFPNIKIDWLTPSNALSFCVRAH